MSWIVFVVVCICLMLGVLCLVAGIGLYAVFKD